MDAVAKSIKRHEEKLRRKKPPQEVSKVPWGCGMGWPELKDYESLDAYVAARRAADPSYTFSHDGRFWLLPG
ncbi:MAG: hypothetical protein WCK46_02550 [Candidatus Adlerbacteria bacterium]